ncbi:NADPH oxidase organizer 1 isoform X1 [Aphelocoma coerulescens]|uniref:NADPH oxidase organizer 1 isoform X1 n=1 Tax=Aphelocoma coerulescens TaxID=39617 RepID=UPI0036044636
MSCNRYPVDVKAVGFMQCRKEKNYMMFVSWSDQNNILIYRTFEEFKKFHKELKRKFPTESGSLRSLPRFKGITMQQRKGGKLNRCLEILKLLETYSQELLKTDVKISRGEEVNQFFKAQTQDLDPSFPENSVVIMPSVFRREKNPQPLSITLPQASESYRCIEAFETKDTKNKPFSVDQKEIVEVLIKDMTGWWLVENADKQIAWFPASYLEELDACEDIQNAFSSNEEGKSVLPSKHEFCKTPPLYPLPGIPAWTSDFCGQLCHHLWVMESWNGLVWKGPQSPSHSTLCHEQRHLLLSQVAPSPIQPGLGHFQEWGSHSLSGHPVPGPPHPFCKKLLPYIQPKWIRLGSLSKPVTLSCLRDSCPAAGLVFHWDWSIFSTRQTQPLPLSAGSLYFVVQAYEAQKADELSLNQGVVVEVVRRSHNGWWLIRYNGCTGYIPSLCLRPYKNPHHKLQTIMSCGLNTSTPTLRSPQPRGEAAAQPGLQPSPSFAPREEDGSPQRSRSRSLPRASSTPELDVDSSSLSSARSSEGDARLAWKPDLSRSLPDVEQARSSPAPSRGLATHSSKSPHLSARNRNDSGFVESSAAELGSSLADPELAAGVPKVPARPSAHEILQRCSTVTKRAVQQSAPRAALPALLPIPSRH